MNLGKSGNLKMQGHPLDLFLKISVLQANFRWLGDLEKIICPWKETVQFLASESFIHAPLLFLGLFLKFSVGCP